MNTQLYIAAGDFADAESSINECITASRKLVDMYFLPQHLALAAEIETRLNHIPQPNEDYEEAENLVEAMLLNIPSASVKASLIATMDSVFRGQFKLAVEHETELDSALRIVERVRGRVVADNLRARPQGAESGERLRVYQELNKLQSELFRTTNIAERRQLTNEIQRTEEDLDATTLSQNRERFSIHGKPVNLPTLQRLLEPDEAVFE